MLWKVCEVYARQYVGIIGFDDPCIYSWALEGLSIDEVKFNNCLKRGKRLTDLNNYMPKYLFILMLFCIMFLKAQVDFDEKKKFSCIRGGANGFDGKNRQLILQIGNLELDGETGLHVWVSYPTVDASQLQRLDYVFDPSGYKKGNKKFTCALAIENEGMVCIKLDDKDRGYLEIHNAYQLKSDTLRINYFKVYPIGLTDSLHTITTYFQLEGNQSYETTGKIDKPDSIKYDKTVRGKIFEKCAPINLKYIINGKVYSTTTKVLREEFWEGAEYGAEPKDSPGKEFYFQRRKVYLQYTYVARIELVNTWK